MVYAVARPKLAGRRIRECDLLVFEKTSSRPVRNHKGLLQVCIDDVQYGTSHWTTVGRLIAASPTWDDMRGALAKISVEKKRIVLAPSIGGL